ncbi:rab gdp/gtp exchange factor [Anaeramoeba flamelloides]|uniref:Rab gdp/gtp exchange factor n=1 Tax=Anaeramoeba flamelloides TaxID=1746091 RepID=A0AAV7ZXF2_9EUKA|nr:rab gdp/gtp exchange factor [Anaeramoeba flamelloides]
MLRYEKKNNPFIRLISPSKQFGFLVKVSQALKAMFVFPLSSTLNEINLSEEFVYTHLLIFDSLNQFITYNGCVGITYQNRNSNEQTQINFKILTKPNPKLSFSNLGINLSLESVINSIPSISQLEKKTFSRSKSSHLLLKGKIKFKFFGAIRFSLLSSPLYYPNCGWENKIVFEPDNLKNDHSTMTNHQKNINQNHKERDRKMEKEKTKEKEKEKKKEKGKRKRKEKGKEKHRNKKKLDGWEMVVMKDFENGSVKRNKHNLPLNLKIENIQDLKEFLKRKEFSKIEKYINNFVDHFQNDYIDPHSCGSTVLEFIFSITEWFFENSFFKKCVLIENAKSEPIINNHLEDTIIAPLYPKIMKLMKIKVTKQKNVQFNNKINFLSFIEYSHLEINIDKLETEFVNQAIETLNTLNQCNSPHTKFTVLSKVFFFANKSLTQLKLIGTDELLSILIYIVAHSKLQDIKLNIEFLLNFTDGDYISTTVEGYNLATFISAVIWLENSTAENFGMKPELFEKLQKNYQDLDRKQKGIENKDSKLEFKNNNCTNSKNNIKNEIKEKDTGINNDKTIKDNKHDGKHEDNENINTQNIKKNKVVNLNKNLISDLDFNLSLSNQNHQIISNSNDNSDEKIQEQNKLNPTSEIKKLNIKKNMNKNESKIKTRLEMGVKNIEKNNQQVQKQHFKKKFGKFLNNEINDLSQEEQSELLNLYKKLYKYAENLSFPSNKIL